MAERTNIPNSPACGLWETLLADALDGLLSPEDEATFKAHMAVCPACTALYEDASRGREWLEFLSPEPEVPEGLLDKILSQTGPGQVEGLRLVTGGGNVVPVRPTSIPAWQRPGLVGRVRRFAEPRLLMTAAMAFFFG
jgi:anti-sigma factor RsiW